MSLAYRKTIMAPADEAEIRELVREFSAEKLVGLLRAQQKQVWAHASGDRRFFEKNANALEVFARSISLTKEQFDILKRFLAGYGLEVVVSCIEKEDALRDTVQTTLLEVVRPNEVAEKYYCQYKIATMSLEAFGIDCKGVPTWESITARLTPEKLALIEKLERAQLILVPPKSRQDLIKALNSKVGEYGIKDKVSSWLLENDALWNDNNLENDLAWEILFVDGRQDIPYNEKLQAGKTAYEQVGALQAELAKSRFIPLVGVRAYLTLMIQGLLAGKPIDKDLWCVVNANVVVGNNDACLGYGSWFRDHVDLCYIGPSYHGNILRLRGVVRV